MEMARHAMMKLFPLNQYLDPSFLMDHRIELCRAQSSMEEEFPGPVEATVWFQLIEIFE